MGKIPTTSHGITEEQATEVGTLLRKGWDVLRSLQFNKKADILRYTVTQEGRPDLGIEPTTELVPGLADLDVYVSRVSTREVMASKKGSDIQSVSGYGESVTFGTSSDSLMREAQDFKDRFERKFGGSVFVVG